MNNDNYNDKVREYFCDRLDDNQSEQVRMWLRDHINDSTTDQLFQELLSQMEIETDLTGYQRVHRRVMSIAGASAPIPVIKSHRLQTAIFGFAAAAVAVVAIVFAAYFYRQASQPKEWIEVYAELGQKKSVTLPDSSLVWLNAGSKLIYPKQFGGRIRQVYLSGEMFANVRKDPSKPFIVSADRMQVKVLGTSFNIKSYKEDPKSEVSLVEGKVSLLIDSGPMSGNLVLAPGDIVRLTKDDNRINFLHFDPTTYPNWVDNNNLYFVEQTLEDIVLELRRRFNVEIIITNKELCQGKYYASFVNNEPLDQILNTINANRQLDIRNDAGVYYISKRQ